MKCDRPVASGSTIDDGGAMFISPLRVQETGSGTPSCLWVIWEEQSSAIDVMRTGTLRTSKEACLPSYLLRAKTGSSWTGRGRLLWSLWGSTVEVVPR